jgi:concanavalin A-like lectin/glucanase superfamily protein/VCBS repeat protein/cadherin-like protein
MKRELRSLPFTSLIAALVFCGGAGAAVAQTGGSALAFNGSNDVVSVAHDAALNLTGNLTIEAWVKFNQTTRTTGSFDRQCIVAKSSATDSYALVLLNETFFNDPILRFHHNGASKSSTSYTWSDVATNRWYHLAVSYDKVMTKIFIDGLLKTSNFVNGNISTSSGPLQFGRSGTTFPLDGQLDEVHLWNVNRTEAQILAQRNHPALGTEPGLVAAWHFNEGAGTNAVDSGSHALVGTLSLPQWISSTVPLNLPVVVTRDAVNVTGTEATLRSSISPSDDDTEARFEWGTSTNYDHTTDWTDVDDDLTLHEFSETLTSGSIFYDLEQQVEYHVRGVARNSFGTSYGADLIFKLPSTDAFLSGLTLSSGVFSPDFETETPFYTATATNASVTVTPTSRNNKATIEVRVNLGSFKSVKSGKASDDLSLNFGANLIEIKVTAEDKTTTESYFITINREPLSPAVTTLRPTNLSATGATFQATVIPNGLATAASFEWGTTTNYGNTTVITNLGSGGDPVPLSFVATGLVAGVTYHYRVTAGNSLGQNAGNDVIFSLTFISTALGLPPVRYTSWSDYDNDGRQDLLLAGLVSTNIVGFGVAPSSRLYRNNGDGTFTWNTNAILPGVYLGSTAWADYDLDGRSDLLLAGQSYDDQLNSILICRLYRNNGDGTFTWNTNAVFPGINLGLAAWGDYDHDGVPDILLAGEGADGLGNEIKITRLYHNNGDGTFTWDTGVDLPQVHSAAAAWADFNNDGALDFLLAGEGDDEVISRIYQNNGDGTFTDVEAGLPGVRSGAAAWGDFNNDGIPDLLLAGDSEDGVVSLVFQNNGDGSFTDMNADLAGVVGSSVGWGDFDNDGRPDILLSGLTNVFAGLATAIIYRNNGDGTFSDINAGLTGTVSGSAVWGDFNNDGRLDAALSGYTQNFLGFGLTPATLLYRNFSLASNTIPASPTGLTSFQVGDGALLSWDFGGDAQTPATGLSYNVRVGSTPGAADIVAPEARTTGFRTLPKRGNAEQRSFTLVSGLEPLKTYYWSVQTIDSAFAGSAFAVESSFTTAGLPPLATTLAISDCSNTGAVLQAQVNPNGAATTAWFQWGLTTAYGNSTAPLSLGTNVSFLPVNSALTGLIAGSFYHYRIVASNSAGTTLGDDRTFEASLFPGRHSGRGAALALNGVNQYLDVPNDVWFSNAFTVEAWVYVRQTVANSQLFNFGNGTATDSVRGGLSDGATGLPYLVVVWQGTEYWVESPTPITPNTWTHLAFVRDAAGNSRIHLNGVQVAAQLLPALDAVVRTNNFIGRGTSPAPGSYANLILDEMRIWSVARSQAEIQASMNGPLSGTEPGLKAYWNFNEGTGPIAADSTANGFDATLVNGPLWTPSTIPFPVPSVVTLSAVGVTNAVATARGTANPNGSETLLWFAWGTSTNYDRRTLITDAGAGVSALAASNLLSGLVQGVTYHYRMEALNEFGLGWGNDMSFTGSGATSPVGPLVLTGATRDAAGIFRFNLNNSPGLTFSVMVSTNLTQWTLLGPLIENPPGSGLYPFAETTNGPRRFYRVRFP